MRKISRTTFPRQAANRWQALAQQVEQDRYMPIVDSFPVFGEGTAFGHDEVARQTSSGLQAHVHRAWPGVLVDWAPADRNYWKPERRGCLKMQGLPADTVQVGQTPATPLSTVSDLRYRIGTVFGQLVQGFHAKRIGTRDLWPWTSRRMRQFLGSTLAVFFCAQNHLSFLSIANLAY